MDGIYVQLVACIKGAALRSVPCIDMHAQCPTIYIYIYILAVTCRLTATVRFISSKVEQQKSVTAVPRRFMLFDNLRGLEYIRNVYQQ